MALWLLGDLCSGGGAPRPELVSAAQVSCRGQVAGVPLGRHLQGSEVPSSAPAGLLCLQLRIFSLYPRPSRPALLLLAPPPWLALPLF